MPCAHGLRRAGAGGAAIHLKPALWWATLAALCAILLAPLLIADVPPALDYPNHLARLALLAAGPDDPVLGPMFAPRWAIIPDLAIDVIGPPLLRWLPIHIAGRGLLGFVLLLNLAGVIALHRALFRRRSYWPLASALVAYNSGFLLGFLNWQIGCGLAMLCAAGWLTFRTRHPCATVVAASLAAVALFFCHLMGVAFFLVLIGSAELRARPRLPRLTALVPVLAGPLLLARCADIRDAAPALHWMTPHLKLVQIASPFTNYVFPLDMATAALVYGGVALAVAAGWMTLAPQMRVAVAALALLYLALPFDLMSASFLDTRVSLMLGFLLFAAFDPHRLPHGMARPLAFACAGLFALRMGILAEVWTGQRDDLAELRQTIAPVPQGASVYVANVSQFEAPAYWDAGPRSRRLSNTLRADYHLPALLLIERGAFWPGLFADPAQHPIALRPRYAALARAAQAVPSHAMLRADPAAFAGARAFDFVLLLEAGADPDPAGFLPGCLTLLTRTDFAALFRVRAGC